MARELSAYLDQDRLDHLDEKQGAEDAPPDTGDLIRLWERIRRESERRQHGRNQQHDVATDVERDQEDRENRGGQSNQAAYDLIGRMRTLNHGGQLPEGARSGIRADYAVDQRVVQLD